LSLALGVLASPNHVSDHPSMFFPKQIVGGSFVSTRLNTFMDDHGPRMVCPKFDHALVPAHYIDLQGIST
jgi:hypothetical protein